MLKAILSASKELSTRFENFKMDDFNPTPDSTEPEAFIQVSKPDEEGPSSEEGEVSSSTPAPAISASDVKPLIDIEDAKDEPEQDIAAPETDSPLSEELKTTTPSIAVCESKPAKGRRLPSFRLPLPRLPGGWCLSRFSLLCTLVRSIEFLCVVIQVY